MSAFRAINERSILLDHAKSIANLYCDNFYDKDIKRAWLASALFEINVPYDRREETESEPRPKKRKRMKIDPKLDDLTLKISENLSEIKQDLQEVSEISEWRNKCALEFVDNFNSQAVYDAERCFSGKNDSEYTVITEVDGESYLVPPKVRFFNAPISHFGQLIGESEKFDLIVLDPPWWNKYIRRVKMSNSTAAYQMLANEDIKEIPLERHLHDDTFVLVWCTNAETHVNAITNQFFPKWGLKLVAVWYWTKITRAAHPVCKFNEPNKKQPYERLFIGLPAHSTKAESFPRERFLYSIPCALHSHKPPLYALFETLKHVPRNPNCLELFARSLHTGCTSVGMEVLKLQNKRLFRLATEDAKDGA
ncbi:N(6)-adenine-specific methyltransferase METTL4 [Anopheles cruzii]|uniref:N(6)-adenine-specific methyltransferase METTL4 n=1 Tax=Anopheles cruzii TaxID=68878 RepID=UPI0022EC7563|nr:N(6)-adenine-specific methyltransferase METTL4 [Anopheles cruzii]